MSLKDVQTKRYQIAAWALTLLVILFWTRPTILGYVLVVIERMPYIGIFRPVIIPAIVALLLILSIGYLKKHIRGWDVCFVAICIIWVLMTAALSTRHAGYILPELERIVVLSIPMYLLGVAYDHKRCKKLLFYASLLGVLVAFAYQAYRMLLGKEIDVYDMNAAYNLLPSIVYLIYWAFEKKKIWYWIFALLGIVLCFSYGTRGPILAVLVVIVALAFLEVISGRRKKRKLAILLILCAGFIWLLASGAITTIAEKTIPLFEKLGFSTRFFEYFLEGNLMADNGRNKLTEAVIKAIRQKPLFGYGIMGDRLIIGGYTHNIVLEFLCSFGLIGGGILLLLCILALLRGVFKAKTISDKRFLISMVTMVSVKLLFSDSFIIEPYFFLILGLSIGAARHRLPVDDQK